MRSSFWYLASPYTKYPKGRRAAFEEACFNAGLLIGAKIPVFCPIAHSHPIAINSSLPLDAHDIWLPADQPFINAAHGMILLRMEGWSTSYGVGYEIKEFEATGRSVVPMSPGLVDQDLLAALERAGLGPSATPPDPSQPQQGLSHTELNQSVGLLRTA